MEHGERPFAASGVIDFLRNALARRFRLQAGARVGLVVVAVVVVGGGGGANLARVLRQLSRRQRNIRR